MGKASGALARGTPYSARDPELLLWVHATCVESFMFAHETFVAPLTADERDRYCAESAERAEWFRIPPAWLPRTAAALDAYLAETMANGTTAVTDTARARRAR